MNALTKKQTVTMLTLQDTVNTAIDSHWMTAGHPYLRAAMIEAVEAMEHHGWKWWKFQEKDLAQLQMELVDIWHFVLSDYLVQTGNIYGAMCKIHECFGDNRSDNFYHFGDVKHLSSTPLIDKLDYLVSILSLRKFSIKLFQSIMADCGMTWQDIYKQYIGKNVLNTYRQNNGYSQGTYRKVLGGLEDNQHLSILLSELPEPDTYEDQPVSYWQAVYASLSTRLGSYTE